MLPTLSPKSTHSRSPEANLEIAATRILLGVASNLALMLVASSAAFAGLTSCEVVVVVNGKSQNSRTLANHFVALRNIPAINVITLPNVPSSEVVSVAQFRSKILMPVLKEIENRKLSNHIQCITYSADFPTGINISEDLKDLKKLHKVFTKIGSLNGLTFLYANVNSKIPAYIDLKANYYTRRKIDDYFKTNPGGDATLDDWQQSLKLSEQEKHTEASQKLESIFESQPHQFPVAYFAAAEAALAGEKSRAINLLDQAIQKGWNAGGYLAKDERFDSLRDDEDFQLLEFLVDERITEFQHTIGFDARTYWTPNGIPIKEAKFGARFLLSTVLGVTRGSGTTLSEAIEALHRSASADFTHPQGTFYFTLTKDVRSTTRKWGFLAATEILRDMGFGASMVRDALPKNKTDVLGAQTGTASFKWKSSGSKFLPGAIADNLTSLGGVMTRGSAQTKLTEFVKNGAAGSSGAVTEPYALQDKFPLPLMYVHYARGATLAEAFYMSVSGPYQLLIVGDPLCQPFSNAPQPNFDSSLRRVKESVPIGMQMDLSGGEYADWADDGKKQATRTDSLKPAAVSILLDGTNPQAGFTKPNISIKLEELSKGYHEIIFRFIADDPLAQRSQRVMPIWIGDPDAISMKFVQLDSEAELDDRYGIRFLRFKPTTQTLEIRIEAEDATRISVWQNAEMLDDSDSSEAILRVDLSKLGTGPIRLQAKAEFADDSSIKSEPRWLYLAP